MTTRDTGERGELRLGWDPGGVTDHRDERGAADPTDPDDAGQGGAVLLQRLIRLPVDLLDGGTSWFGDGEHHGGHS